MTRVLSGLLMIELEDVDAGLESSLSFESFDSNSPDWGCFS